jgi:hypothetical protein
MLTLELTIEPRGANGYAAGRLFRPGAVEAPEPEPGQKKARKG